MTTTETKPLTNVRNIVEYAIRTAAAYGYSKGKRGTDIKANIGDLIDQAARQVAAHDREVAANAIRLLGRNLDILDVSLSSLSAVEEQELSYAMLDYADRIEADRD